MTWVNDSLPREEGYYLTFYKNKDNYFFKAFWYSTDKQEWVFRFKPDVKCWWNKPFDYYFPCQMQENVNPVPESMV